MRALMIKLYRNGKGCMNDMYANIGHLFTSAPYRAEQTDTRQAIHRHDPEFERRRGKGKNGSKESEFDIEDHADVSIGALKAFLENFVKTMGGSQEQVTPNERAAASEKNPEIEQAPQQKSPPRKPQSSPQAARAASIYQRTAQKTSGSANYANSKQTATAMGLKATDIRTIHQLIVGLDELSKRNVQNLRIERSDSFLNSLLNAVQKASSV